MDKFKNFLKGKKIEKHFKHTGKGERLGSPNAAQPSVLTGSAQGGDIDRVASSDVAAQAALKRLYKDDKPQVSAGQKKIQMIAQRELEEERRRQNPNFNEGMGQMSLESRREPDVREFEHSGAITGVYYTCELLGEDACMKKADLITAIEEFLLEQIAAGQDDPTIPAVMLLYSVNTSTVKNAAIETIGKYLQNIIENPTDPKYRRIRVANKAFQERVRDAKGGLEFIRAVGFCEEQQSLKDGDPLESFYVMPAAQATDTGRLVAALEALREGQAVPIKVARNVAIFHLKENERVTMAKVSPDFFDLTAEEVKRMQQMKTEEVDRMLTLRTREMRERDEKQCQWRYKYTLLRIRLPDRYILQGTFGCYEPLSSVRSFVGNYLSQTLQSNEWTLKDPTNGTHKYNEASSLGELGLAPAAVLHVEFQRPTDEPSLAEEYREQAATFVA